jgi:hypothetical protein
MFVQDFYGKGVLKIMKKGLILAITPLKSIKRVLFKDVNIYVLSIKGAIS